VIGAGESSLPPGVRAARRDTAGVVIVNAPMKRDGRRPNEGFAPTRSCCRGGPGSASVMRCIAWKQHLRMSLWI